MVARAVATVLLLAVHGARMHKKITSTCGVKGASGPSKRIVAGNDATECEWRWQAQLRRTQFGRESEFCGGSLISPEWVLTSGMCVTGNNNSVITDFQVRFGDWKLSQSSHNEQTRSAAKVYRHPGYAREPLSAPRFDLAMVKLDSPVEINDCVGTVCLPEKGEDVRPTTRCWSTGWGQLYWGEDTPDILQETEVGIISNYDCWRKFDYTRRQIDQSMICVQGETADGEITAPCEGDRGGPLVCEDNGRWILYGAYSWSQGCAMRDFPGISARVHDELDWIEDLLAGNEPTTPPGECPWYCGLGTCLSSSCKDNCDFCQK